MRIKTEVDGQKIRYSWKGLRYTKGNELYFKYDVNVSQTPRHLANFMFGIIASPIFSFNRIPIEFDELTKGELEAINSLIKINYLSMGCSGRSRGHDKLMPPGEPPKVKSKKIVPEDPGPRRTGHVLCSNGMGKDGLAVASLVKELGFDMSCFIVEGQLREKIWDERMSTMKKFYALRNIPSNIVTTNYFQIFFNISGIYCFFLGIPLAYHYGSEAILSGTQIHVSKTSLEDNIPYCPNESIFGSNHATKATGINFSSPTMPISEYGAQKLLVERYPELLKYQRSCNYGMPWCNHCSKCRRTSLYLELLGKEYRNLGLKYVKKEGFSFPTKYYGGVMESDILALKMRERTPYSEWLVKTNETVYPLMWKGKEISNILEEHFESYSHDPGPDGFGYTCVPSKWRKWLDEGFVELCYEVLD